MQHLKPVFKLTERIEASQTLQASVSGPKLEVRSSEQNTVNTSFFA